MLCICLPPERVFQLEIINFILFYSIYFYSILLIVPITKKEIRGITLISCFAKLFTSVINNRLKTWEQENEISTDAQFGFKTNHSTIDAIFILKYLIDKKLNDKKNLYCAFIDLKKAFDSVSRTSLWYKLIKCGIDGKILKNNPLSLF